MVAGESVITGWGINVTAGLTERGVSLRWGLFKIEPKAFQAYKAGAVVVLMGYLG